MGVPSFAVQGKEAVLTCDYDLEGQALYSVKWYMDGVLLKQLPLCDEAGVEKGLCDIDPSKLLLEHVTKSFHGNFSCEGANAAGWSDESPEEELVIHCESLKCFEYLAFAGKGRKRTKSVHTQSDEEFSL